jgi:hypothetical protein
VGGLVPSVSTIQSSQTRAFRRRLQRGRFCADFAGIVSDFSSLCTLAVSRANFWPPVSVSKNSVPGSWIWRGKGPFGGLKIGDSGRQKCRFEPRPLLRDLVRALRTIGPFCRTIGAVVLSLAVERNSYVHFYAIHQNSCSD